MNDFAGSADVIAEKLVAGGMDPQQAMTLALRMAQSRQQADQSILGGVPTQPPVSDVPPATEILGGDPSRLFQRQPTTMERIKDLPKDVLGAADAMASMGSLVGLAVPSMMYALRPGQKTQGDPMEFALRNMYMPRSERGPSHLAGLGEVLESLPQTGPLPELQAFAGVGRGVGRQLAEKGRQAGRAMAPAAANVAEDILRRQGLLMDVVKPKGGNWLTGSVEKAIKELKTPYDPEVALQDVRQMRQQYGDLPRYAEAERTIANQKAVDQWIDRNLTNYIKKEMATPEDPVRKLAEQGIEPQGRFQYEPDRSLSVLQFAREELGFPSKGMGKSPQAQNWETIADETAQVESAGDIIAIARSTDAMARQKYQNILQENPWLLKVDPSTPVYSPKAGNWSYRDTGFDHIVDVLKQDLNEGRIRPEQLNKVSMEQAVRRTYEYDQEMAKKMREAQIKATEGMPVHKEYPEGYRWIELTNPKTVPEGYTLPEGMKLDTIDHPRYGLLHTVSDPKGITQIEATNSPESALLRFYNRNGGEGYKALEDSLKYEGDTMGHCVGGYCPDVLEGRSQIFSLRDAKGEPHVTIEVQPPKKYDADEVIAMFPGGVTDAMKNGDLGGRNYIAKKLEELNNPNLPGQIVQIKGKQNRKPKDEYLPFVQDFVRSGNWSQVGDPQNAGLRRYTDVFNDAEQRKIEALNLPVPDHMWLTGEEIQTLHNAINPEGKRLKYNASGQIIGDSYKQGGSVNHKAVESARRALEKAMAKGGEVKMAGGGRVIGKAAAAAAKQAKTVLSPAESEVNKAKFLADSAVQQRMYTGTSKDQDFSKFNVPKNGAWFTPSTDVASAYAKDNDSKGLKYDFDTRQYKEVNTADRVMPVYLRATNPYQITDDDIKRMNVGNYKKAQSQFFDSLRSQGHDSVIFDDGTTVVLQGPHQIKSAIGNRGTYDITSPELNKAHGGLAHMSGGGLLGKVAGRAAGKKSTKLAREAAAASRAPAKSKQEIDEIARRIAEQTQPGFARVSPESSINPAGKSQLLYELEQRTPMVVESTIPDRPVNPIDYEQQLGKVIVGVPGDPTMGQVAAPGSLESATRGGKQLVQVGDVRPETPVQLYGGPRYGANLDEVFWASNLSPARAVQNLVKEMAAKYGPEQVLGKYIKMSPESSRFAMHNLDALISVLQPEKLAKDKIELLNNLVRKGTPKQQFPQFAGFEDPINLLLQAQMDSKLRKQISEVLEKPTVAKEVGFPFPGKVVQSAITDPELRNVETGITGYAIGKMNPEGKLTPSSHPTYEYDIPGQAIGKSKYLVPYEVSFPDFAAWYRSRPDVQAKVDPVNMMKSYGPRQVIDQQYIDEMKMYEEAMKRLTGKKKGGLAALRK